MLADISSNILTNAYTGNGDQLEFVYKQANLTAKEYRPLVAMWGPPERIIFCLREPASFIASADKKFSRGTIEILQKEYVESLRAYGELGGDVFEYGADLDKEDYLNFLSPLNFSHTALPDFRYKGARDEENTTDAMWRAYNEVRELHLRKP